MTVRDAAREPIAGTPPAAVAGGGGIVAEEELVADSRSAAAEGGTSGAPALGTAPTSDGCGYIPPCSRWCGVVDSRWDSEGGGGLSRDGEEVNTGSR